VAKRAKQVLTIQQILNTIEGQFRHGKTYLSISIGLIEAEPVVSGVAPTFFGIMAEGGFVMAQMCLARLYDKHRGTVTIPMLFDEASRQHKAFQKADAAKILTAVLEAKAKVRRLSGVLDVIRHRRNIWFAHTDPPDTARRARKRGAVRKP
jgi:hypothetical protein